MPEPQARPSGVRADAAEPVRGGHPPHPEPGSAPYGSRDSSAPGGAPRPGGRGGPFGAVAAQSQQGPRQDYLDAFDAQHLTETPAGGTSAVDDVFAAGAPGRRRSGPASPRTERSGAQAEAATPSPRDRDEEPRHADAHGGDRPHVADSHDAEEPGASGNDFAKGRRGRTVTGITAAAITTVLTVLVAGQVATGEDDSRGPVAGGGSDRAGEDSASRSEGRPTPTDPATPTPAPVTYEEEMAGLFTIDADMDGTGDFTAVTGGNKGSGSGTKFKYRVDVEEDLGLDGKLFARAVHTTLNDDRSWTNDGERDFERISSGDADFVITLASPGTTAEWCAKSGLDTTEDNVSCDSAFTERIMINGYRWARGAKTFGDSRVFAYRQMLINHEVGHRLGFDHVGCAKEGALAPVMMQQTKSLTTDGRTCKPNPWPHPDA